MYEILLLDMVSFSKETGFTQLKLREELTETIKTYFYNYTYYADSTGDGYYIALSHDSNSFELMNEFICGLIETFSDKIEFRFAMTCDSIVLINDTNDNKKQMTGESLTELNRILSGYKKANLILFSSKLYSYYISDDLISEKTLDNSSFKILTYSKESIQAKHGDEFIAYSIALETSTNTYGHSIEEELEIEDDITNNDFSKILQETYTHATVKNIYEPVNNSSNKQKIILYSFFNVNDDVSMDANFLFLSNNINKPQTIEHIKNNISKIPKKLIVIVNKRFIKDTSNKGWKTSFINIIEKELNIDINFLYLDEFLSKTLLKLNDGIKEMNKVASGFFINPTYKIDDSINHEQNSAIKLLSHWIDKENSPAFIVLGEGGIGKTWLLREFVNTVNGTDNNQIALYIDSNLITSKFLNDSNNSSLDFTTLADLLKSYYMEILSDNRNKRFMDDKKLIDLLISSGNLIIVIDGLDEIASSLKEKFIFESFIKNIFEVNKLLGHTKIIISSRTVYWNTNVTTEINKNYNINTVTIKGFSEENVKQYFKEFFMEEDNEKFDLAMKELKDSPFIDSEGYFWPFPVHIIADEIKNNKYESCFTREIESDYFSDHSKNKNEYLITRMLLRDIERHKLNIELDQFLEIFSEILFEHNGHMDKKDMQYYIETILPNSRVNLEILSHNPLINYKEGEYQIVDFLIEYFIYIFIRSNIEKNKFPINTSKILAKYYDGDDKLIKNLKQGLKLEQIETFLKSILNEYSKSEDEVLTRAISTLLYILFESSKEDIYEKTKTVLKIFHSEYGLKNLFIYGTFYPLNFEDIRVYSSRLLNYDNFFKSNFNGNTKFIDSEIIFTNDMKSMKNQNLNDEVFDKSCILSDNLKDYLQNTDTKRNHKNKITKDIKLILRNFFKSNKPIAQKMQDIKLETSSSMKFKQLMKELIEKGVIDDKTRMPPYNLIISTEFVNSALDLISNDYSDAKLNNVIDKLVEDYYI